MLIRSKYEDAPNDSSGDLAFALPEFERRSSLQAASDCHFLLLDNSWSKKREIPDISTKERKIHEPSLQLLERFDEKYIFTHTHVHVALKNEVKVRKYLRVSS